MMKHTEIVAQLKDFAKRQREYLEVVEEMIQDMEIYEEEGPDRIESDLDRYAIGMLDIGREAQILGVYGLKKR